MKVSATVMMPTMAPTATMFATPGMPTDSKAVEKPLSGLISVYFCIPVSTRVTRTYSVIAMPREYRIAFGRCLVASFDSSAAVLIASYPNTAKNTVAAPVKTAAVPNGK